MISKKFRSRLGMTLAETLIALAIFAILSVALVVGTTAAWKVYQKAVAASEARTLQSTLAQALADELRYARNIQPDGSFDSETFGVQVSVKPTVDEGAGRILIGAGEKFYDLLPAKAYTNGLKAGVTVSYDENGFFKVDLTVQHKLLPGGSRTTSFTVRALNASGGN